MRLGERFMLTIPEGEVDLLDYLDYTGKVCGPGRFYSEVGGPSRASGV
jgi:hypothetical protein